jgi:hypothetical protein
MKPRDLAELLASLREKSQKNLVLTVAFFLQNIRKAKYFSANDIKAELVGRISGMSKINVGAIFINHCGGFVEPVREISVNGLKLWRLTSMGVTHVMTLLTDDKQKIGAEFSFALDHLHPVVRDASIKLFKDGHLSDAVETAFRAVNKHLRKMTNRTVDGGVPMMHKMFNPVEFKGNKDCFRLNALVTQSDKDEQEGYRFLYAGAQ